MTVLVQSSGLDILMTLSPYFAIKATLFHFFLIPIADTRTFNSALYFNRTKRFLFLMFSSSNGNLTTLFPLSSTERKRSLVSILSEIPSHLESTRLTLLGSREEEDLRFKKKI